jgi:hypothetical protein
MCADREGSRFFFEKKNQNTFVRWQGTAVTLRTNKVFLLLSLQKKKNAYPWRSPEGDGA